MNTPWGKADSKTTLARGISWVSTPGHGGFMIASNTAKKLLTDAAIKRGQKYGGKVNRAREFDYLAANTRFVAD